MAKPLFRFDIYLVWRLLGMIEAESMEEAIKIASEWFGQESKRLIAVRRR
jgi:hypothetical protein